jgi:hypothetical protein
MTYRLHGLNFRSEIELPRWPTTSGPGDVSIRHGKVPRALPGARRVGEVFAGQPGICLLDYSQVGRILIAAGRDIVVPPASASLEWLRLVLSGTAVALLLHQRGRLCLHASSVVMDGRAILLAGASGAGKSTTAAALVERGAMLLADDITAVDTAPDGTMVAFPGLQTLRLSHESVAALPGHARRAASRDVADEKQLIASPGAPAHSAYPIAAICWLRREDRARPVVRPITGVARFAMIEKNLFRPRMARVVSDPRRRFEICSRLATTVPLVEIARPESGFHLEQLCACIVNSNAS